MRKLFPILLLMLLVSCMPKVEEKDRIETTFKFSKAMFLNYKEVKKSINRTGSAEGGMGTLDLYGTIEVKQTTITLLFSDKNVIEDFKSVTETANIKDCFLADKDNGYKNYEYKTDKGEFTVFINDKGEVYSISYNDWEDNISFLK